MAHWQLYVDESGAAWQPWDRFLVGGLLVPHRRTRQSREELDRRLRSLVPALAWPPHANRLTIPAVLVEAVARGCDAPSDEARIAHGLALESDDPGVVAWREAVRAGGGETDRGLLEGLDRWLERTEPRLWTMLQNQTIAIRSRLVRQLGAIRAVAVANVDPRTDGPHERDTARYLRVFQGLVERVSLLVAEGDQLVATVARYGRRDQTVEESALNRSIAGLSGAYHGRLVAFAEPVQYYDASVDPGLVLADIAAGAVRNLAHGTLASLARGIQRVLGVPALVESCIAPHAGPLPSISSEGEPRQAVSDVLAGTHASVSPDLTPPWVREQAEAWIGALRGRP